MIGGSQAVKAASNSLCGPGPRLLSLDFFRGAVMFLLIGETTGFADILASSAKGGPVLRAIGLQFQHHPWHGLRLWDLGLPFFLFISGAAMVFAYRRRWEAGETWMATLGRAARRAGLLFALGWALSLISPVESGGRGEFLLDVLPQLALAGFIGFLLLKAPARLQAGFALGLLLATELLYRLWAVPGFDQPFTAGRNFGSYVDLRLFGRLSEGGWVTFDVVPAAVFVLAGVLAAGPLRRGGATPRAVRTLALAGVLAAVAGLALDPVTPVIRRLCTSSFVLVGVGLALLALALACRLFDGPRPVPGAALLACVGANPIFIYLFAYSGGGEWLRRIVEPFALATAGWLGGLTARLLVDLGVWGLMWGLCFWLYERKILIRI